MLQEYLVAKRGSSRWGLYNSKTSLPFFHHKRQKSRVVGETASDLKLWEKEWWNGRRCRPRFSSWNLSWKLQWRTNSIPDPKSLVMFTTLVTGGSCAPKPPSNSTKNKQISKSMDTLAIALCIHQRVNVCVVCLCPSNKQTTLYIFLSNKLFMEWDRLPYMLINYHNKSCRNMYFPRKSTLYIVQALFF